ncbi:hypothetical protein TNCV_1989071 [Trichonephila clavipes]|nr:hypothetical protein TNCV_1989071 [Trichonephila clavipes]
MALSGSLPQINLGVQGRETVLASSFYSQYGLPTISGLPLHDGKGRYCPEKSMTNSPKGLSQLVAIYFVVFQCNPWLSLFRLRCEVFQHHEKTFNPIPSLLSGTLLWASDTKG